MGRLLRRLRQQLRRLAGGGWRVRGPILVYQMGKVGSLSVYESLQALGLRGPIYHCHMLNNLDEIEAAVRATLPNPHQSLVEINRGRALRAEKEQRRWPRWNVISLVRAPVQRNVSAFFESLTEVAPDALERHAQQRLGMDELSRMFIERFAHNAPADWFDTQMKPVFGIDVFAEPFPTQRGYHIYHAPGVRLLVLRLEDLSRCAEEALGRFVGLRGFRLRYVNDASHKPYHALYRDFVAHAVLPAAYLTAMHASKYANHFYRPEELAQFAAAWAPGRTGRE